MLIATGRLLCVAAGLCAGFWPRPGAAADINGYALLTTDYVFRGVTYSDGHGAVQLGADVTLDSGLYFGVWGSSADISNGPGRQRDLEVDYYAGYSHALRRNWTIDANVVAYTFPDATGEIDYDYVEYSIAANYDDRAWLEYSYSPDVFHTGRHTHHVELYAEWLLPAKLALGAGAGYYDVSSLAGRAYAYWQLGVSRAVGRIQLDLRFHDTNHPVPIFSDYERADGRIVLSAKLPF